MSDPEPIEDLWYRLLNLERALKSHKLFYINELGDLIEFGYEHPETIPTISPTASSSSSVSPSQEPVPPAEEVWIRFLALEVAIETHRLIYINEHGDLTGLIYEHPTI